MTDKTRVIVIGLDGATWNIIEPLVQAGKLPAIQAIMQEGCYGELESCIPHRTFPAWKCYSTGKNPGKLGVYSFVQVVDVASQQIAFPNSESFNSEEMWDILSKHGISCGVLDMPTTYPPKVINGFMISQGSPKPSGFTFPAELERELKDEFSYKTEPDYYFDIDKEATVRECQGIIKQRFDVARHLTKRFNPSLFHVTIFQIDPIQHFCYGQELEDSWIMIDNGIKSLLADFQDQNCYVMLMSDHGQTDRICTFQLRKWLEEKGLLSLRNRRVLTRFLFDRIGLRRGVVLHMIAKLRLLPLMRAYVPRGLRSRFLALFPVKQNMLYGNPFSGMMDWGKSTVVQVGGSLYINHKLFDSEKECEDFRENLICDIKDITDPETGVKVAKGVYKREEIYSGPYVNRAPDIVIYPSEGYMVGNVGGSDKIWNYTAPGWHRTHKLHGIFLAKGPGIRKGVNIKGAMIYDLAPTILHIFGIPIPQDIDGRVLKEMFEEDSTLASREITYQQTDAKAAVKHKIKSLKDLGRI